MTNTVDFAALAEPFDPREVEWKPQVKSKDETKALAICYIDARCVMNRLDAVAGPGNWKDEYHLLPDGNVHCRLSVRVDGEWITKEDVGAPSDGGDVGDKRKGSYSDALKRAGVKWGIGRYLYDVPGQWVGYDKVKKQLAQRPTLPAWAMPKAKAVAKTPSSAELPSQARPAPTTSAAADKPPAKGQATPPPQKRMPANGKELAERLQEADARLVRARLIKAPGELVKVVTVAGTKAGHPSIMAEWNAEGIKLAMYTAAQYQHSLLCGLIKSQGVDPAAFCQEFGIEDTDRLPSAKLEQAAAWIRQAAQQPAA